ESDDNQSNDTQPNEAETEEGEVVIPVARVKRIMKMDPDTNIISKKAALAMSKATTLFIDILGRKLNDRMAQDGTKTIKTSHLIQVCSQTPSLRFLLEDLTQEEMDSKRVRVTRNRVSTPKETAPSGKGIASFFQ
ncbi:hypothetical protein WA588_004224, partial [Blastocystis sp. NMH]